MNWEAFGDGWAAVAYFVNIDRQTRHGHSYTREVADALNSLTVAYCRLVDDLEAAGVFEGQP